MSGESPARPSRPDTEKELQGTVFDDTLLAGNTLFDLTDDELLRGAHVRNDAPAGSARPKRRARKTRRDERAA